MTNGDETRASKVKAELDRAETNQAEVQGETRASQKERREEAFSKLSMRELWILREGAWSLVETARDDQYAFAVYLAQDVQNAITRRSNADLPDDEGRVGPWNDITINTMERFCQTEFPAELR